MNPKEAHKYISWCLSQEIRIYAVTEFEYQNHLLLYDFNKGKISQSDYKLKRELKLQQLQKSKSLHICVERKGRMSIGEKIFYSEKGSGAVTVDVQIMHLYYLIYNKECKEEENLKLSA